jgi:hypothetical protein
MPKKRANPTGKQSDKPLSEIGNTGIRFATNGAKKTARTQGPGRSKNDRFKV